MLELKADGQAEQKLLELLLSPGSQIQPAAGALVPAAAQQQLDSMRYVIQTQQEQLAQAQAAIAEYEQTLTALTAQPSRLLLSPAAKTGSSRPDLSETPRRYITGGPGQGNAITPAAQTAQTPERAALRPRRQRPGLLATGWPKRLTKTSLLLALFCLVSWGVFQYAAPPVWNWLFPAATEPSPELEKADEPPPSDPQSNLDAPAAPAPPGSAASKAGTQPNALDL